MKLSNRLSIEFLPDEDFSFIAYKWFKWNYRTDYKVLFLGWIKITAKGEYDIEKIYGPAAKIADELDMDFPSLDKLKKL